MNLIQNPELLDRLALAYAVGTLRGRARHRLEYYARQNAAVSVNLRLWQERMAHMTELQNTQTAQMPSPNVWKRIEIGLQQLTQIPLHLRKSMVPSGLLDDARMSLLAMRLRMQRWRNAAWTGAALAGLCLVVGGITAVHLNGQLQSEQTARAQQQSQLAKAQEQLQSFANKPQMQYVAVLSDAQASANILVTFDPDKRLLILQRVGAYQEAEDKSLQLWALPQGNAPQSLGVMSQEKLLKLTTLPEQLKQVPTLAISLEPKGGVPSVGGPTGPVLFKGALLQTAL